MHNTYTSYESGYGGFVYTYGKNGCANLSAYTYQNEVTQFEVKINAQSFSSNMLDLVLLPATVFFTNNDAEKTIDSIKSGMTVYNASDEANGSLVDYWYTDGDFELLITTVTWKTGFYKGKTSFSAKGLIRGKHHMYTYSGWPTPQYVSEEDQSVVSSPTENKIAESLGLSILPDTETREKAESVMSNFANNYNASYMYVGKTDCESVVLKDGYAFCSLSENGNVETQYFYYVIPSHSIIYCCWVKSEFYPVWENGAPYQESQPSWEDEIEADWEEYEAASKDSDSVTSSVEGRVQGMVSAHEEWPYWKLILTNPVTIIDFGQSYTLDVLYFYEETTLDGLPVSSFEGQTITIDSYCENYRGGGDFYLANPKLFS